MSRNIKTNRLNYFKILVITALVLAVVTLAWRYINNYNRRSKATSIATASINFNPGGGGPPISVGTSTVINVTLTAGSNYKISGFDITLAASGVLQFVSVGTPVCLSTPCTAFEQAKYSFGSTSIRGYYVSKQTASNLPSSIIVPITITSTAQGSGKITVSSSAVSGNVSDWIFDTTNNGNVIEANYTFAGGAVATATPTPSPTATPTPTSSPTPTSTPSPSPSPSATPTPTVTPTPTPSPSPTTTPSPTVTPTGSPNAATLKFKVLLPDVFTTLTTIPASSVQVSFYKGSDFMQTSNTTLSKLSNGVYESGVISVNLPVSPPADNLYTVYVKQAKSLKRKFTGVKLISGPTLVCTNSDIADCGDFRSSIVSSENKKLFSGDWNGFSSCAPGTCGYNAIDIDDQQKYINEVFPFGPTPLPGQAQADYNLDGFVDIDDYGIIINNFGKSGDN